MELAVGILISLLVMLVQLGIIVGIVVLVLRATGRGGGGDIAGSVRRFFVYGFLFVALVLAAEGARQLLGVVFEAGRTLARREAAIAAGVSLLVVGGALWGGLWRYVAGKLRSDPQERSGFGWMLYLDATLAVAVVVATITAVRLGSELLGVEDVQGDVLAGFVVWSVLWVVHHRRWRDPATAPTLAPVVPALVGSLVGLATAAGGVGVLLTVAYRGVYDALAGGLLAAATGEMLATGGTMLVVGAAVWGFHWFRLGTATAERSPLWLAYVLLAPVLASVVALLTVGAAVVFQVLVWFLGDPGAASAAEHFVDVPWQAAVVTVAVAVWAYHRRLLAEGAAVRRSEPRRVYDYLLAGAGLVAVAGGVVIVLLAIFAALSPGLAGPGAGNTLLGGVTALAVGGPVWWWHWRRCQAGEADPAELRSITRRIYLIGVFGIAGAAVLVATIVVLQGVLELLLSREGSFDRFKGALAAGITGVAVGAYHLQVWRHDRRVTVGLPEAAPPKEVVLVAPPGLELAERLRDATGAHVRVMETAGGAPPDAERVAAAVEAAEAPRLLVIAVGDEVRVLPLR